jgi:hypothetical protein
MNLRLWDVTNLFPSACFGWAPVATDIPSGWLATQPGMNVNSIKDLPLNTPTRLGAVFSTPYGRVRLTNRINVQHDFCSGHVWVTRTSLRTWVIQSPRELNPVPGADGMAVILRDFSTQRNTVDMEPVADPNLPFRMWVTALQ